jgi:hypothetical protein
MAGAGAGAGRAGRVTRPAPQPRGGALLLRVDGWFLILSGCFGLAADLASYLGGIGPFGPVFHNDPTVIGVVEAHGLAILTGIAACMTRAGMTGRYWHWHLAAAHALLGGSNVAFFDMFEQVGAHAGGIAITAVHFGLVAVQAALALGRPAGEAARGLR